MDYTKDSLQKFYKGENLGFTLKARICCDKPFNYTDKISNHSGVGAFYLLADEEGNLYKLTCYKGRITKNKVYAHKGDYVTIEAEKIGDSEFKGVKQTILQLIKTLEVSVKED